MSTIDLIARYGDYLYEKKEFDDAMEEYIKTIGYIEPSYVIKRFLDWHRLPNLTKYLECLHTQGNATSEHTTLLLKCYSRMHLKGKLRDFVHNEGHTLKFDVDTAIEVLRECGAIDEAKELAIRSQHHSAYLQLLLQETHEYETALTYLRTLSFANVDSLIQEYGRILLQHAGDQTTDLLVTLCVGYVPHSTIAKAQAAMPNPPSMSSSTVIVSSSSPLLTSSSSSTSTSSSLYSSAPSFSTSNAEMSPLTNPDKLDTSVSTPTLRDYVRESIHSRSQVFNNTQISNAAPALLATLGEKVLEPVYANPSSYIHLFASQMELLQQFLTRVVKREKECDCVTWNALIELLLRQEKEKRERGEGIEESEVMKVLRDPRANYDNEEALVLVQSYKHHEGELFLYERNEMYSFLLQQYLNSKDSQAAIDLCKRHGEKQNALWIQLIMIIAKQNPVDEVFMTEILDYLEKTEVLPLLYVLQVLCENDHIQLKMVMKYVVNLMKKLNGMISMVGMRNE